ncbi:neprilysin-1 [Ixodes scapularis]
MRPGQGLDAKLIAQSMAGKGVSSLHKERAKAGAHMDRLTLVVIGLMRGANLDKVRKGMKEGCPMASSVGWWSMLIGSFLWVQLIRQLPAATSIMMAATGVGGVGVTAPSSRSFGNGPEGRSRTTPGTNPNRSGAGDAKPRTHILGAASLTGWYRRIASHPGTTLLRIELRSHTCTRSADPTSSSLHSLIQTAQHTRNHGCIENRGTGCTWWRLQGCPMASSVGWWSIQPPAATNIMMAATGVGALASPPLPPGPLEMARSVLIFFPFIGGGKIPHHARDEPKQERGRGRQTTNPHPRSSLPYWAVPQGRLPPWDHTPSNWASQPYLHQICGPHKLEPSLSHTELRNLNKVRSNATAFFKSSGLVFVICAAFAVIGLIILGAALFPRRDADSWSLQLDRQWHLRDIFRGSRTLKLHRGRKYDYSTEVRMSLDLSANPCNDFYSFVCGRWPQSHPEQSNEFSRLQSDILIAAFKKLEQARYVDPQQYSVSDHAGEAFRYCLLTHMRKSEDFSPFYEILGTFGFSWPQVKDGEIFDILELAMGSALKWGIPLLFDVEVTTDLRTDNGTILRISRSEPLTTWIAQWFKTTDKDIWFAQVPRILEPGLDYGRFSLKVIEAAVSAFSLLLSKDSVGDAGKPAYIKMKDVSLLSRGLLTTERWLAAINRYLPEGVSLGPDDEMHFLDEGFLRYR